MRSSVRLSLSVCLSACLFHYSTAALACDGFAADRPAVGDIDRQQRCRCTALSSKCEQCRVDSRRRKLNTDMLSLYDITRSPCCIRSTVLFTLFVKMELSEASILWSHHEETRELPGERDNAMNNAGARRRGRPRTAWMDNIKTWTGLSVEESVRMTEDRDKWRKLYVHGVANTQIEDG